MTLVTLLFVIDDLNLFELCFKYRKKLNSLDNVFRPKLPIYYFSNVLINELQNSENSLNLREITNKIFKIFENVIIK